MKLKTGETKVEETKTVAPELKRDDLIHAAQELNRVLELDDKEKINVKHLNRGGLSVEDLAAAITTWFDKVEAEDFEADPENEKFQPFAADAVNVFEAMGLMIPKKPAPVKTDDQGKKVKKEKNKDKAKKVTRYQVFPLVFAGLKPGKTIELKELCKKVDDLYGSHNEAECGQAMGRCIQLVVGLGLAKYEGTKLTKAAAA